MMGCHLVVWDSYSAFFQRVNTTLWHIVLPAYLMAFRSDGAFSADHGSHHLSGRKKEKDT